MGEGRGGEEKFLSFTSLPFSLPFFPFSPETPDTQATLLRAVPGLSSCTDQGGKPPLFRTPDWPEAGLPPAPGENLVATFNEIRQIYIYIYICIYLHFSNYTKDTCRKKHHYIPFLQDTRLCFALECSPHCSMSPGLDYKEEKRRSV